MTRFLLFILLNDQRHLSGQFLEGQGVVSRDARREAGVGGASETLISIAGSPGGLDSAQHLIVSTLPNMAISVQHEVQPGTRTRQGYPRV